MYKLYKCGAGAKKYLLVPPTIDTLLCPLSYLNTVLLYHLRHYLDQCVWEFPPKDFISPTKKKTKWYLNCNEWCNLLVLATQLFDAALALSSSIGEIRSVRNLQSCRGSKDVLSVPISKNTGQGGSSSRNPNVTDYNIIWYSCTSRVATREQRDVIKTIVPQQTTCVYK